MDVRGFIRQRPSVAGALAAVMIVGAAVAIYVQARDLGPPGPGKAFFTADDGKTFFVDSARKLAPFDKGGKPAYRAHVFECGGKRVVGFMSGYTPDAMKLVEEAQSAKAAGRPPPNPQQLATVATMGLMVKRPGDPAWVPQADAARATMVRVFRCPDGSTPQEIEP